MRIIDLVIVQHGIKVEPKSTVMKLIELSRKQIASSELSLFEKVVEHELITHIQAIAGILVHKAALVVGEDIEIAPLHTVNFDNRRTYAKE